VREILKNLNFKNFKISKGKLSPYNPNVKGLQAKRPEKTLENDKSCNFLFQEQKKNVLNKGHIKFKGGILK